MKIFFLKSPRWARKLIIALMDFTVLLTEFIWARNLLVNIKNKLKNQFEAGNGRTTGKKEAVFLLRPTKACF